MSETSIPRKAILEKQMKAAKRKEDIGLIFMGVGGFLGVPMLLGFLNNIGEAGYLDFWIFGSVIIATVFVFVMAFFPILFLLGFCMWKYYSGKCLRLQKELNHS